MRNAPFEVHPIAGALGAELRGVDLAGDLPDATIGAIRQALLDHLVIFFRDQDLPPERFLSLARRFGTPIEYPFVKGIEGFPEIINVAKLEHETVNFGGVWHSDTTYLQEPPMATLLVAREVPETGGDTLFANQYLAYETLSDTLRGLLAGLQGDLQFGEGRCQPHPRGPHPFRRQRRGAQAAGGRAPGGAHASGDRAQGALRQPRAHGELRRHDGGGKRAAARIPVPPPDPAGIHLPLPLDRGLAGDLGQSLRAALRGERLRRPAPRHAAHHAGRRPAGVSRWSLQQPFLAEAQPASVADHDVVVQHDRQRAQPRP